MVGKKALSPEQLLKGVVNSVCMPPFLSEAGCECAAEVVYDFLEEVGFQPSGSLEGGSMPLPHKPVIVCQDCYGLLPENSTLGSYADRDPLYGFCPHCGATRIVTCTWVPAGPEEA
jgi:hypothetical protein